MFQQADTSYEGSAVLPPRIVYEYVAGPRGTNAGILDGNYTKCASLRSALPGAWWQQLATRTIRGRMRRT